MRPLSLVFSKRLVLAGFGREGDVRAQRLHEFDLAAGRSLPVAVTAQVADVALEVRIAPYADQGVDAVLIDDARVGLQEGCRAPS